MARPGENRPEATTQPGQYGRAAIDHVLATEHWHGWEEMLSWLRASGNNDPELNPDEMRGIRQDAERAWEMGLPFSNDAQQLKSTLNQARRDRG
ncbi:hypothetical protein [Amycolatopsis palatopharyngis]|uniref:hypothetical protein n=1 Tax=Amycolatopsis palatopharyngis TaxID=187982 RepID=UPI000E2864D0|nr:hypothetical protein [Amycolatopsis palatopharyngis]